MTKQAIKQAILNHWKMVSARAMKTLDPATLEARASGQTDLVEMEIQTLMAGGMSRQQAAAEAMPMFLTPLRAD